MPPSRIVSKLYQYYRITNAFLYAALFTRWLILFPLVGGKFLPGGIHKFLISVMVYSTLGEIGWLFKFRTWKRAVLSRTMLKDLTFINFIATLHYHDDYEHALVLRNISYSLFIVSLALSQCYVHCSQLFKKDSPRQGSTAVLPTTHNGKSMVWKLYSYVVLPIMYISEFNLLLLNIQYPSYHKMPRLEVVNKIILVLFFPLAITCWKKQW
ncbi:beta-1,6-glucan synthesis-associated protein Keg1p [Monosporozyma unispora]